MRNLFLTLAVSSAFLTVSQNTWAFPAAVRQGYVNCSSCHYNPAGGGILTSYGREISRELLSTWGTEHEVDFAYGLIPTPEWLALGGDFRAVESRPVNVTPAQGMFHLTQADLEAVALYRKWRFLATFGRQEVVPSHPFSDELISRRHYLEYQANKAWSVRAGRFFPNFGIWNGDYSVATRKGLDWDVGTETYNVEANWITEHYSSSLTAIFGRPDFPDLHRKMGLAATASYAPVETYKGGLGYFYRESDFTNRHAFGPYGILGFTPHSYLLTEWDFQRIAPSATGASATWGLATYNRFGYEFVQGFFLLLTQDLLRTDFANTLSVTQSYSAGFQWFPRPHLEIQLYFKKQRVAARSESYDDSLTFFLHFYP